METGDRKNLRFSDEVVERTRPSLIRKKTPGPTARRCSRKKTMYPSYRERSANDVGKRIAVEVRSPERMARRVRKEIVVDRLLQRNNMIYYANRVYRLTDTALANLEKRLLTHMQKLNSGERVLVRPCIA